jgi:threonine synthase
MGFRQYSETKNSGFPKILGVQAEGSAPLVRGEPVKNPETVATAIRIGKPARGEQALEAAHDSGGRIIAVSDNKIIEMQRQLAGDGIWVEPASAAGLAGLKSQIQSIEIDLEKAVVVAVCTGHGLKDPDIITKSMVSPTVLPPDTRALERVIFE